MTTNNKPRPMTEKEQLEFLGLSQHKSILDAVDTQFFGGLISGKPTKKPSK